MQTAQIVGAIAAICSTASFAPQAWKIIRTRETKDISTGMYLLTVSAFAAWVIFGIMLGQYSLVASNAICFLLAAFILMMKLLPRDKKDEVANAVFRKR